MPGVLRRRDGRPEVHESVDEKDIIIVLPAGWKCSIMASDSGCELVVDVKDPLKGKDYSSLIDVTSKRRIFIPQLIKRT